MICLYAGLISASGRARKKLFPCERNASRYFCGSKLRPLKLPSSSNKVRLTTSTFSSLTFMVIVILSEANNLSSFGWNPPQHCPEMFRFARHDKSRSKRIAHADLRSEQVQAGIRIRLSAVG